VEGRAPADVVFTKVKAHCSQKEVRNGLITAFDLAGNSAADALAVAGACQWRPDAGEREAAWRRASAAISVQKMMVDIVLARQTVQKGRREEPETSDSASDAPSGGEGGSLGGAEGSSEDDDDADDGTSRCSSMADCISISSHSEYELEPD